MARYSWSPSEEKSSSSTSHAPSLSGDYSPSNMSEKRLNETQAVVVVESDTPQITFPDGGTQAWLNIAGCTLICLTAFGQVNAFGVFQTYYATHQLSSFTASDISWIGSIQILLLYLSGLVLGRIFDVYGARGLLASGCLLSTFSMMMLSLSTQYYQIFLSQGVGLGLGIALQFYPLLVIPAHWFRQHRAIALGIVVAGSSIGGVVLPIMLSRLFEQIGFAWSVRTMGFMVFFLQAISIPLIKERLPPSKNRRIIDLSALKDIKFVMHALSGFFTAFGLFTPFWYIELFMLSRGSSTNLAFYTVAIMNAAGAFGRITSGFFADRLGRFNTLIPVAFLQSIACFAIWSTSERIPESIVFAVVFGFASASYSSVASSCVAQITEDPSQIGSRTGMFMVAMSPGIFAGPPISGAILSFQSTRSAATAGGGDGDRRYLGLQMFCGAMLFVGACFAVAGRFVVERKWRTKV